MYVQHDEFKVHEKFLKQKFYDKYVKLKNKSQRNNDCIIIITTSNFYEKHVKQLIVIIIKKEIKFKLNENSFKIKI